MNKFLVPQTVRVGEIVRISCLYEISGANLHALKLFKDDKEVSHTKQQLISGAVIYF